MSSSGIVPIIAVVAGGAMAAAAGKKKIAEEEKMVKYSTDDLEGWEFKIVRANTRRFRSSENIEKVIREEARAGWQLVEKFDDYRLRFKRRVEKRSMDRHLNADVDPYRSNYGFGAGGVVAAIIGAALFALGVLFLFSFGGSFDRGVLGGVTITGLILGIVIFLGLIVVIVAIKKNR